MNNIKYINKHTRFFLKTNYEKGDNNIRLKKTRSVTCWVGRMTWSSCLQKESRTATQPVGTAVGDSDGEQLGHCNVGIMLGALVGNALGVDVGVALGELVGNVLGRQDGFVILLAEGFVPARPNADCRGVAGKRGTTTLQPTTARKL